MGSFLQIMQFLEQELLHQAEVLVVQEHIIIITVKIGKSQDRLVIQEQILILMMI